MFIVNQKSMLINKETLKHTQCSTPFLLLRFKLSSPNAKLPIFFQNFTATIKNQGKKIV